MVVLWRHWIGWPWMRISDWSPWARWMQTFCGPWCASTTWSCQMKRQCTRPCEWRDPLIAFCRTRTHLLSEWNFACWPGLGRRLDAPGPHRRNPSSGLGPDGEDRRVECALAGSCGCSCQGHRRELLSPTRRGRAGSRWTPYLWTQMSKRLNSPARCIGGMYWSDLSWKNMHLDMENDIVNSQKRQRGNHIICKSIVGSEGVVYMTWWWTPVLEASRSSRLSVVGYTSWPAHTTEDVQKYAGTLDPGQFLYFWLLQTVLYPSTYCYSMW